MTALVGAFAHANSVPLSIAAEGVEVTDALFAFTSIAARFIIDRTPVSRNGAISSALSAFVYAEVVPGAVAAEGIV